MIERHDVLPEYTDEYLLSQRKRGIGYTDQLLQAPAEYRHGIAIRVHTLVYRISHQIGFWSSVPTEIGFDDAYAQALMELHAQGVALLPVPA